MSKDIGASAIAKLKNKSKEDGISLQMLLVLFFQEEFTRRLEMSRFSKKIILKGGYLLYTVAEEGKRPTMDSDYLLQDISSSEDYMIKVVNEIINGGKNKDIFKIEIKGTELIAEHREYNGIRINFIGHINNTKTPFVIDFGVGDTIVPAPCKRILNTLIDGFDHPEVYTYSFESVIAEKFETVIARKDENSRMKDFYDIYNLSLTNNFLAENIKEALKATLKTRGTICDEETLSKVLGLSSSKNMNMRWTSFCKKVIKIDLEFENIVQSIVKFMTPIMEGIIRETKVPGVWDYNLREWK